jgi:hypothetical protein
MGRSYTATVRCTDMRAELIFDDQLARESGLSLDQLYEQARTSKLPFAVSTVRPRRLFIEARDLPQWRAAVPIEKPSSEEAGPRA